jgi:hypothetical protein
MGPHAFASVGFLWLGLALLAQGSAQGECQATRELAEDSRPVIHISSFRDIEEFFLAQMQEQLKGLKVR